MSAINISLCQCCIHRKTIGSAQFDLRRSPGAIPFGRQGRRLPDAGPPANSCMTRERSKSATARARALAWTAPPCRLARNGSLSNIRSISNGCPAIVATGVHGFGAQRTVAGVEWRCSTAAAFSHACIATIWSVPASAKSPMIGPRGGPKRSGDGLDGNPGSLIPMGGKPNGKHWRTFDRLTAQHDAFADASWVGMAARLEIVNASLSRTDLDNPGMD